MIRLIREGSEKHPWIIKIIIIGIAVTFTIGMGWFGYDQAQQPNAIASVGPYSVSLEEYRRAYTRMYRFYKEQMKQEEVDEENLKQMVIDGLVDNKIWLMTADDLEMDVSPETLKKEIMEKKDFQQDGKFDPAYYHRLLANNRYSPKQYEQQLTKDVQVRQAQMVVQDVATLTPAENQEIEELAARQTAGMEDQEEIEKIRTRIRVQLLFQKKQRALKAFQASMRNQANVEIRKEFL